MNWGYSKSKEQAYPKTPKKNKLNNVKASTKPTGKPLKSVTSVTKKEKRGITKNDADAIFDYLVAQMKIHYPKSRTQTVMLYGGAFDTTWEDSKGDVVLNAKFLHNNANNVDVILTGKATRYIDLKNYNATKWSGKLIEKFRTKKEFWDLLKVDTPVHTRFEDKDFGDKTRMAKVSVKTPTKVQFRSVNQPSETSWLYKHELKDAHIEDDSAMVFEDEYLKRKYRIWHGYA